MKEAFQIESDPRIWIAVFILPVAVVAWIRFLKELAPASMLANIFMLVGLLIVFYDVFDRFIIGKAAVSDSFERGNLNIINEPLKIFTFLGMVFYSFEGIGVVSYHHSHYNTNPSLIFSDSPTGEQDEEPISCPKGHHSRHDLYNHIICTVQCAMLSGLWCRNTEHGHL